MSLEVTVALPRKMVVPARNVTGLSTSDRVPTLGAVLTEETVILCASSVSAGNKPPKVLGTTTIALLGGRYVFILILILILGPELRVSSLNETSAR